MPCATVAAVALNSLNLWAPVCAVRAMAFVGVLLSCVRFEHAGAAQSRKTSAASTIKAEGA